MSEFEPIIPIPETEISRNFRLGREVIKLVLNYENSFVALHDYPDFDYVIAAYNNEEFMRVWRQDDITGLIEEMQEKGFKYTYAPIPSLDDQEAWYQHNTQDIDKL